MTDESGDEQPKEATEAAGDSQEAPASQPPPEEDEDEDDLTLEEHALIVVAILKPVTLTMLIVVLIVFALHMADKPSAAPSFMIYQEKPTDSTAVKLGGSLLDAFVFVVMVVIVTFVLVMLYKYRCIKIIMGWMMMSCDMMLALFGGVLFYAVFRNFYWPLDWITFSVVVANFSVIGIFAIFWRAPVKLTQAYLIAISALMAIFFTRIAEWTTWVLLLAIAIYDLFAVLCPRGPLKMLLDLSEERGEPIPALLYNGSVVYAGMMAQGAQGKKEKEKEKAPDSDLVVMDSDEEEDEHAPTLLDIIQPAVPSHPHDPHDFSEDPDDEPLLPPAERAKDSHDVLEYDHGPVNENSVRLGLGDFIFYSVLIGRAAMYDITTVFTCLLAIITGLFLTLIMLALFRKALPALPFSIFLGFLVYFLTRIFLIPYVQLLGANGIFL